MPMSHDDEGAPLLIDAHGAGRPIVWALYEHARRPAGPVPTLIEWDNDVPEWPELFAEAERADAAIAPAAAAIDTTVSGVSRLA